MFVYDVLFGILNFFSNFLLPKKDNNRKNAVKVVDHVDRIHFLKVDKRYNKNYSRFAFRYHVIVIIEVKYVQL